ncbi:MAG: hypothetical protein WCQ90_01345 [Deltaproteobacteria bacterium]|nr:hypothetical protein [Pseudomonadota bacterium]
MEKHMSIIIYEDGVKVYDMNVENKIVQYIILDIMRVLDQRFGADQTAEKRRKGRPRQHA